MDEKNKLKRGYAAEACRQVGVTRTVYETAKKKQKTGGDLSKKEIEVLVKYGELIEKAEEQLKSLMAKRKDMNQE